MLSQLSSKLNCLTCGSYVNAEKVNSYKMEVQDDHPSLILGVEQLQPIMSLHF